METARRERKAEEPENGSAADLESPEVSTARGEFSESYPPGGGKVGVVHRCRRRELDRPIVAKNGLTSPERRGLTASAQPLKRNATA